MEKDILEKISLLVDKVYEQIDKSLDYSSFEKIENSVESAKLIDIYFFMA